MSMFARGHGRRGYFLAAAAAVAIAGGTLIGVAVAAQKSAPQPPASTAQAPVTTDATSAPASSSAQPSTPVARTTVRSSVAAAAPVPANTRAAAPSPTRSPLPGTTKRTPVPPAAGLAPSAPARISIAAIGVHASFVQLGLAADGSIQVPSDVTHVGWYRLGPAPGQVGPAVVLGHVDSAASGAGVFFKLGALKNGDTVQVSRADGHVVTFTVYAVREYPKDQFPTQTVYGNTTDPQLRLITCGGSFDHATGHYRSNVVVFARAT